MDRANLHVPTLQNQHLSVHGQSFHSIATHSRLLWSEFPMPYQFIYTFSVCVSKDKSSWVNDLVFPIKMNPRRNRGWGHVRHLAPSEIWELVLPGRQQSKEERNWKLNWVLNFSMQELSILAALFTTPVQGARIFPVAMLLIHCSNLLVSSKGRLKLGWIFPTAPRASFLKHSCLPAVGHSVVIRLCVAFASAGQMWQAMSVL